MLPSNFLAPLVGLEPTTYRLTAERSTNWAKEEYIKNLANTYLHMGQPQTIVGFPELNFCVRNGNRCDLSNIFTRKLYAFLKFSDNNHCTSYFLFCQSIFYTSIIIYFNVFHKLLFRIFLISKSLISRTLELHIEKYIVTFGMEHSSAPLQLIRSIQFYIG